MEGVGQTQVEVDNIETYLPTAEGHVGVAVVGGAVGPAEGTTS